MTNKYRPRCEKMGCEWLADSILHLPTFGPVYFCAAHALSNFIETAREVLP